MLVILRMKPTVEVHGLHVSFLHLLHRGAHSDSSVEFIAKVRFSEQPLGLYVHIFFFFRDSPFFVCIIFTAFL